MKFQVLIDTLISHSGSIGLGMTGKVIHTYESNNFFTFN
jgi:hypothetical protein